MRLFSHEMEAFEAFLTDVGANYMGDAHDHLHTPLHYQFIGELQQSNSGLYYLMYDTVGE